jgi:hypothetical protein
LHLADGVSITFTFQKNAECDATVSQHWTHDSKLCPVCLWSSVIKQILSYPGTDIESPINTYRAQSELKAITLKMLLHCLFAVVSHIGEAKLGFKTREIGSHFIWSGAVMAMYLTGIPIFTIMLLWRWSSDAFLHYMTMLEWIPAMVDTVPLIIWLVYFCFNEELSLLPKNPTEAKLQATSTRGESTEPT